MSSDSDYDSDDSENDSMCGADDNFNGEVTGGRSLGVEASGQGAYRGRGIKWKIGQTIHVKFMDGTSSNHYKVEKIAKTWEKYANVTFNFVTKGYSDIRITFNTDRWSSRIGTYALNVSKNEPTMNLGIKRRTKPETLKRHVLHEFGHALGLLHEHQSPAFPIVWNEKKVFAKNSHWSKEKVRHNILNKARSTNYTKFDPRSIMLYNVDKRLTKNGRGIKRSNTLSKTDKEFIGEMYPFPDSDSSSD
ncbi:hypothetical protein Clacol_004475 [Clathrus columnatus]|uniref:Peptidase metallopeptidase domain-containing protein n=1 Tax=Clathrus columnatus TaxID=1419009 RepID=A0AAV5AAJ4_9AGAM|nr:hypothetical protein Clacol_004475 [Clathrus columnatus]